MKLSDFTTIRNASRGDEATEAQILLAGTAVPIPSAAPRRA